MLNVQDITVTYSQNPRPTIEGFHLQMKPGEICSIVEKAVAENHSNPFYFRSFARRWKGNQGDILLKENHYFTILKSSGEI